MNQRVVSIVPSLTESIASTPGGREILVGATPWCTHPHDLDVERIGGTKNPDIPAIAALKPTVVVANEEENRAPDLAELAALDGVTLVVTHIRTVDEALTELGRVLRVCGLEPAEWLTNARDTWALYDAVSADTSVAVPIWRKPWMAVGSHTFTGDVLRRLGYRNILEDHEERYPKVTVEELASAERIVLPDEPYEFSADDGPDAFDGRASLVTGRYLTWYGPSMVNAPRVIRRELSR